MAVIETIPLGEADRWATALEEIRHGFQHTHDFATAMHLTTGDPTFLVSISEEDTRLVCALVERELGGELDVASVSGLSGFAGAGAWSRVEHAWQEHVRDRNYVSSFIGLHPFFAPEDLSDGLPTRNFTYALDLRRGSQDLVRCSDRNRRRQLRGWSERRKDLVLDRTRLTDFLLSEYEPFMTALGARPPHLSAAALRHLCRSESCEVVGAAADSLVIAVYLFGATPHAGECLVNVATEQGRSRATDLLWHGVTVLGDRGIPLLNLGGGMTPGDSVARSKERFNPLRLPLRAIREIHRPDAYRALCREFGADTDSATDYFPAYRGAVVGEGAEVKR